jgi:hypothetical protein
LHIGIAEFEEQEALEGLEEGLVEVEVGHLRVVVQQGRNDVVHCLSDNNNNRKFKGALKGQCTTKMSGKV